MSDSASDQNISLTGDQPATEDEFRGKAHLRVAQALVETITTETGGRAIGLEGAWGSGKSTVVEIAAKLLRDREASRSNESRFQVFVFDAWAHQGDPIRRVFLDELIQKLADDRVINETYWKSQHEKLRARTKRTIETRAEKLSWVARIGILLLPIYPVAVLLLRSNDDFELPFWGGGTISAASVFISALLVILTPYLFVFGTWISWRPSWNFLSKKWWVEHKDEKQGRSVLHAFTRQTDEVTTEQLVREEEATTVEFNAVFEKILEAVAANNTRLIVVLDNLDRLPEDLIRETWATMRNFFVSTAGSQRNIALQNVWLVVPFDRSYIEGVFSRGTSKSQNEKSEADRSGPGFIEKTFEVVFRVSPPLMTNWQEFLESNLRKAFKLNVTDEQVFKIFKLFDLYRTAKRQAVTPREIKAYINSITSLWRQWKGSIPIEYQSLYVLYRTAISQDISKLQDSTILDEGVAAYVEGWDWVRNLAAAHFNVSPDDALEFLLSTEIENSLSEESRERLLKLEETSGFSQVLDMVVERRSKEWAATVPRRFITACAAIATLTSLSEQAKRSIWRRLTLSLKHVNQSIYRLPEANAAIAALVQNSDQVNQIELFRTLSKLLVVSDDLASLTEESPQYVDGQNWQMVFETALTEADKLGRLEIAESAFNNAKVPAIGNQLIGFIAACSRAEFAKLRMFASPTAPNDLSQVIISYMSREAIPEWFDGVIRELSDVPAWLNWGTLCNAIRDRLISNSPAVTPEFFIRISRPLRVAATKTGSASQSISSAVEKYLKQVSTAGVLHALLAKVDENQNPQTFGAIVGELLVNLEMSNQVNAEVANYGNVQAINDLLTRAYSKPFSGGVIDSAADWICTIGRRGAITKLSLLTDQNREIFRAVVRGIAARNELSVIGAGELVLNFDRISEIIGDDLSNKLVSSLKSDAVAEQYASEKWLSASTSLIRFASARAVPTFASVSDALKSQFNKLTKEQWITALGSGTKEIQFLQILLELNEPVSLGIGFFDAMEEQAKALVGGNSVPENLRGGWPFLLSAMAELQRRQFSKSLRDRMLAAPLDTARILRIIGLYGKNFMENADWAAKSDDAVRMIIDRIIVDGSDEEMGCLEQYADIFADVIRTAASVEPEVIANLKSRFKPIVLKFENEKKNAVLRLMQSLGVPHEPELSADAEVSPPEDGREDKR